MPCRHLRDLYEICNTHNLKLSSSDLIRIVCPACGVADECPSVLFEEYDSRHPEARGEPAEGRERRGLSKRLAVLSTGLRRDSSIFPQFALFCRQTVAKNIPI